MAKPVDLLIIGEGLQVTAVRFAPASSGNR